MADGTRSSDTEWAIGSCTVPRTSLRSCSICALTESMLKKLRRMEQHFPRGRQANAFRQPLEQRHAHFFFDVDDLPVKPCRGNPKLRRRAPIRTVARHGVQRKIVTPSTKSCLLKVLLHMREVADFLSRD